MDGTEGLKADANGMKTKVNYSTPTVYLNQLEEYVLRSVKSKFEERLGTAADCLKLRTDKDMMGNKCENEVLMEDDAMRRNGSDTREIL